MDYTRDKLCSMVRKWQTLIEVNTPVKTTDGYTLRVFCIGFTKRNPQAKKKTAYAKHAKVRAIRAKMVEIVQKEFATAELKEVVNKLIHDRFVFCCFEQRVSECAPGCGRLNS
jgi:small subunit ribosomal protein S3Ae